MLSPQDEKLLSDPARTVDQWASLETDPQWVYSLASALEQTARLTALLEETELRVNEVPLQYLIPLLDITLKVKDLPARESLILASKNYFGARMKPSDFTVAFEGL